ncbi:MAG: hypothetical protein GTO02_12920 [Candidatus Dadabacteria bacterium]|nr:hypothetical protein [Candidatus Dadabacteria bacterium]NIQ15252.1 hypothetical protein [Candidatus Dadabacteria bacterium]
MKDVDISISNLEFHAKRGLVGEELYLSDRAEVAKNPIKIEKFRLLPSYFSSLKQRKLIIEDIEIQNPTVDFTGNIQKELKKLFGNQDKKEKDGDKVSIKSIRVENLVFVVSEGYKLKFNEFILNSSEIKNGIKKFNFKGLVSSNNNEESSELIGKTDFDENNNSLITEFKVDKIHNLSGFDNFITIPENLDLFVFNTFSLKNDINSTGNISLRYSNNPGLLTKADLFKYTYDATYIDNTKQLLINSSSLIIENLLDLSSKGVVDDLGGKRDFNISSNLKVENISFLNKWISTIKGSEIKGNLATDKLLIVGSRQQNDLRLVAKGILNDFFYSKEKSDKKVKGLTSEFNLIKYFGSKSDYDFLATGKLESDYFETKNVPLSNVSSTYSIKLSGQNLNSEFSNIRLNAFGGEARGFLNYILTDDNRFFKSKINGKNLKINESNNNVLKIPLKGDFSFVNLQMDSVNKEYNFKIDFSAENFNLDFKNNNSITAEKLSTLDKLHLRLIGINPTKVELKSNNLNYENAKFRFFNSASGSLRALDFNLVNNSLWNIKTDMHGSGVNLEGFDLTFKDFVTDLSINADNKLVVTGGIDANDGNYKNHNLYNYSGEFEYSGNTLNLYNSDVKNDYFDELTAENVLLSLPRSNKKSFDLSTKNIKATRNGNKLKTDIEKVELKFKPVESSGFDYKGHVSIRETKFNNILMSKATFDVKSISKNLSISDFKADLFDGKILGQVDLNLQESPINFYGNLNLIQPVLSFNKIKFKPDQAKFDFSGNLIGKDLEADSKFEIKELVMEKDGFSSIVNSSIDFKIKDETIYLLNGFINNGGNENVSFSGNIHRYLSSNRVLQIIFDKIPLGLAKKMLYPILPFEIQEGDLSGNARADFYVNKLFEKDVNWLGAIEIEDADFEGLISLTDLSVKGINGLITLKDENVGNNPLVKILGNGLKIDRRVFKDYKLKMEESKNNNLDYLTINEIDYGFMNFKNVESLFEINKSNINLNYFSSEIYRGKIMGSGFFSYLGDKKSYDLSLMFSDMSLESISKSLPSMEGYITGRFDGLFWLNMGKQGVWSLNGPFSVWAKKSKKEKLTIGRALLERIGAKGRFITGSSRRYDKGKISGYIKEGFITFKEFEISNSTLGYKDLKIIVDKKKNSISVKHMLSVIREIARRASSGGIKVDYNKEFIKEGDYNEN